MTGKRLLASVAILLALAANTANAAYNVSHYCELVKIGTKFPSFDSCQDYYTCQATGYSSNSCAATESFDKNSQSCKPSSTVSCYYGVANACATTTAPYVPDPTNCNGYIYCKNSVNSGTGSCPDEQIFDGSKGACVYGKCTNDLNGIVQVDNLCDIMQSGSFFGDFDECNVWHKCASGVMQTGNCGTGLVYNTIKGMCLSNDGTMCKRVQNPSLPPTDPCDAAALNTFKGDSNTCSVYYKCDGTNWTKLTCTTAGQYFDTLTSKCIARQTATPTAGCNRCQYSTSTWVNAVDPQCLKYLICKDGVQDGSGSCATGDYFNEQRQGCMTGTTNLATYSIQNGACYSSGPTTEEPSSSTTEGDAPSSDSTTEEAGGAPSSDSTTEEAAGAPTADSTTESGSTEDASSTTVSE